MGNNDPKRVWTFLSTKALCDKAEIRYSLKPEYFEIEIPGVAGPEAGGPPAIIVKQIAHTGEAAWMRLTSSLSKSYPKDTALREHAYYSDGDEYTLDMNCQVLLDARFQQTRAEMLNISDLAIYPHHKSQGDATLDDPQERTTLGRYLRFTRSTMHLKFSAQHTHCRCGCLDRALDINHFVYCLKCDQVFNLDCMENLHQEGCIDCQSDEEFGCPVLSPMDRLSFPKTSCSCTRSPCSARAARSICGQVIFGKVGQCLETYAR